MNARVSCPCRPQVYKYWSDAKMRARTVAVLHGYAVVVMSYDQFEVIYGETLEQCVSRADGRKFEAEFNEYGLQTS